MRFLTLTLALVLSNSIVAESPPADINPRETLAGFKYSQKLTSLDGRENIWSVKLFPNGKYVWEGNHLGSKGACSKKAGHFVKKIDMKSHSDLVKLAYSVAKEQKALSSKTKRKGPPRRRPGGTSIGVELGEQYILSEVKNLHSDKMKDFKTQMKSVLNDIMKHENSRPWAMEISASEDENNIIAKFVNIGKLDTRLITSKDAKGSFFIKDGNKKVNLKYSHQMYANLDKVLHPGESYTIKLSKGLEPLKGKLKVVFQNQYNRPVKHNIKPLNVTLCDEVK
jgi:hypothetical protein